MGKECEIRDATVPEAADIARRQLEDEARAALKEYLDSNDLEELTGTPASTWRYWAHIGSGPTSLKIERRRVWKKSTVLQWLESPESASA